MWSKRRVCVGEQGWSSPMEAEMVECVGRLRRRVLWLERKAGTRSWRALNARLEGLSFLLREVLDPGRV